jgi:hypothetical protein
MQTETFTAKQIHEDFYSAHERIYVDAVGMTKRYPVTKTADRLKAIGFTSAKPVQQVKEFWEKKSQAPLIIAAIEYYYHRYPQNKFITEEEIKILCKKYGLLYGDASNYIGDIPEKNLAEIEKFKLMEVDWQPMPKGILHFLEDPSDRTHPIHDEIMRSWEWALRVPRHLFVESDEYRQKPADDYSSKETERYQPPFKICAPPQDFNTLGWEVREGYKLVWDPIVIQPVEYKSIKGGLIVAAWGDEASDGIVVNGRKN